MPDQVATYYGRGDELHLAFNFAFLLARWDAPTFGRELAHFDGVVPAEGWPDLVLSNHDIPRHATRWDHPVLGEARARAMAVFLLATRGTPFLYYGEELGMRNGEIPPERRAGSARVDPAREGVARRRAHAHAVERRARRRLHARGEPWLPLAADWRTRNVDAQRADRSSLLWLYRDLLALRRRTPALERGTFRELPGGNGVLAWERRHDKSRALVALNFADVERTATFPSAAIRDGLWTRAGAPLPSEASQLVLGPCEAAVLVVDD